MSHPDTQIPKALLAVVTRWIQRVINDYKISDRKLEDAEGAELLRGVLGNDVTFGLLRGLTGDKVLAEARELGVRIPRNAEGVFTAFARAWSPEIARCSACELPALRPYPDRSGLEVLPEGTACPWCDEGIVRVVRFRSTLTNWVTGGEVALDMKYDVSARGARLPLQEDELRGKTREDLRELLDREDVLVHLWLRYLVAEGHQDFGLSRAPLVILASLGNDSVMQHGPQVVAAHVLAAKRSAERPSVVTISTRVHGDAADGFGPAGETSVENLVYGVLCRLLPPQFEKFLFHARVRVELLSSVQAPQAIRAREVMGLVQSGVLELDRVRHAARIVAQSSY
jgi:hypothetical protein